MNPSTVLKKLFLGLLVSLLTCTAWASRMQPLMRWGGLTHGEDRYWTVATLMNVYMLRQLRQPYSPCAMGGER